MVIALELVILEITLIVMETVLVVQESINADTVQEAKQDGI